MKILLAALLLLLFVAPRVYASAPKMPSTLDDMITVLSERYDQNESLVRRIINCEGGMYGVTHINNDRWHSKDLGLLQVNEHYHADDMKKIGLDIYNQYDSLEYGFILLHDQGLAPWSASKSCWS